MADRPLKSSYELALEKLKARDRERGTKDEKPLSDEQKRRIGEVRTQAQAKLAELEILWQSRRRSLEDDPEGLLKAEQEYTAERVRVEEQSEAKVAKIRRGE